jgi:rod shape-determining protein MreC
MAGTVVNTGRILGVSAALFFLALFLTAYSARNPELGRFGYKLVDEVMRPFQSLHYSITHFISESWREYIALRGVRKENLYMRERLEALESRNSALLEYEFENKSLRSLLSMQEQRQFEGMVATVIGYDPSSWQRAIVIDKGKLNGLEPGMSVISGTGLVGQITSVGRQSSRVLLISDPLSGVDGFLQSNRARGVVEGDGNGGCSWKFVLREEDVKVGDRVISSGLDGIFPRGLLIGIITEVSGRPDSMFHDVSLKPSVNMEKVENVFVVTQKALFDETKETP